jgi:hypothetical protein
MWLKAADFEAEFTKHILHVSARCRGARRRLLGPRTLFLGDRGPRDNDPLRRGSAPQAGAIACGVNASATDIVPQDRWSLTGVVSRSIAAGYCGRRSWNTRETARSAVRNIIIMCVAVVVAVARPVHCRPVLDVARGLRELCFGKSYRNIPRSKGSKRIGNATVEQPPRAFT